MLNISRILIPVDFSVHCTQALGHARELAAIHGSELDLLHVVEEAVFPSFYKMGEEAMYGDTSSVRERALDALSDCLGPNGPDLGDGIEFHVEAGRPKELIVQYAAEHDIDLIVISTHGLSGVERALMGSVAERVVRDAPCPVFVVKAYGKSLLPNGSG